jgi:hypothetical protein
MGRSTAAAAALYLLLAVAWAAPSSLRPARTVPDLGDAAHLGWVLSWNDHQVVRRPWALFESNGFHPYPHSLAYTDHLLPEALLVAPVYWLTGNPVLLFNAALLAALTLSALAMFLLVRHLTGSTAAALLAGVAYAFNSFTQHELARVHVLSLQWWPLAWLFLDRFARESRPRDAGLAAAALALQGLSGTYYLAYTLMLLPPWLAALFVAQGRRPSAAQLRRLAAALALAALPVALMLIPYLRLFRGLRIDKGWPAGADLLAYVDPGPRHALWGALHNPLVDPELPHFLGFAALLLILLGLARTLAGRLPERARAGAWLAVMTAGIGLLLSLGPLIHVGGRRVATGPYELLYRLVPPARAMAGPERAGALVLLGSAVLLGLGAAAVFARIRPRLRLGLAAALVLLLPLEHWSPPPAAAEVPTGRDVPPVYRWLAREPALPVAELPLYPERQKKLWSLYLHFSTAHWRPVPIGRASFYPPAHDYLAWSLRGFPDDTSLALLDRLGIHTLVVHPRLWPEPERGARLRQVDAHPRLGLAQAFPDVPPRGGESLGLGGERVYVLRPGPAAAAPCRPADEIAREAWSLSSTGVNRPQRALDGDRATAWFTARPQRPGDRFEVMLAAPQAMAAVAIDLHYPFDEFGRNLVLFLRGEDGTWQRVAWADGPEERWEVVSGLVRRPREARLVMRFPPQRASGLRLMVGHREEEPAWPRWSLPELRLFRRCDGGAAATMAGP